MNCSMPAAWASSTAYWIKGLSTTGSISFGIALVAGRKRVPRPATGNTALRTGAVMGPLPWSVGDQPNAWRTVRSIRLFLIEGAALYRKPRTQDQFGRFMPPRGHPWHG